MRTKSVACTLLGLAIVLAACGGSGLAATKGRLAGELIFSSGPPVGVPRTVTKLVWIMHPQGNSVTVFPVERVLGDQFFATLPPGVYIVTAGVPPDSLAFGPKPRTSSNASGACQGVQRSVDIVAGQSTYVRLVCSTGLFWPLPNGATQLPPTDLQGSQG